MALAVPIFEHQMSTMKVGIHSTVKNGRSVWVASWRDAQGKRPRKFFATREQAEKHAASIAEQSRLVGVAWLALTPKQQTDAVSVAVEAAELGVTIREVWDSYRSSGKAVPAKALMEAVRECVSEKRKLGRRPKYCDALEYTLARFATGQEKLPVAQIKKADLDAWLAQCRAPSVRASFQSRLATLFAWCVAQGYLTSNPCDRLGKVSLEQRAPVILTPEQVDAALAWLAVHEDFRAYLLLGLFAGIRPDELARLQWESIDLTRGLVTIDAATSKVRRRRIVPLAPRARALLPQVDPPRSGPIWAGSPITLRRRRRALAVALGIPWSADLLRHTCASYMMARDHDAGKVADVLGNSPGVLLTRYRELVAPEDAVKFWTHRV